MGSCRGGRTRATSRSSGAATERWNSGEISGLADIFTPDIEYQNSPEWPGQRARPGAETVTRFLKEEVTEIIALRPVEVVPASEPSSWRSLVEPQVREPRAPSVARLQRRGRSRSRPGPGRPYLPVPASSTRTRRSRWPRSGLGQRQAHRVHFFRWRSARRGCRWRWIVDGTQRDRDPSDGRRRTGRATVRLVDRLERLAAATGDDVTVVLFDGPPIRRSPPPWWRWPRPAGRPNSADAEIVRRSRAAPHPAGIDAHDLRPRPRRPGSHPRRHGRSRDRRSWREIDSDPVTSDDHAVPTSIDGAWSSAPSSAGDEMEHRHPAFEDVPCRAKR